MSALEKSLNALNTATRVVVSVFMLSSVIVIFYQVFTRYVLGFSEAWTEEFARYASVWMTFLGIGLLARTREHIRLDFLDSILGRKSRFVILFLETVASLAFYGILGWEGAKILQATNRQIAPGLQISLSFVYAAIPIGCFIFAVFAFELFIRKSWAFRKGE